MRKILLVLFIIAISMSISAQENARNGHAYSPQGTLRLFIVFADIVDDPYSDSIWAWPIGQLPDYVDNIIDQTVENIPQGYLSKYFQEASCGDLHIIGDYYPELIELHTSDLNNNSKGFTEVVRYLDTLPGNDITTKHGYHLSDFDKWDFTEERFYMPATSQPDNRMDCCYRHCPSTVSDMVQSRLTGACLMPECTSIHWLWTAELWIQNA